jgi:hypothetical protein
MFLTRLADKYRKKLVCGGASIFVKCNFIGFIVVLLLMSSDLLFLGWVSTSGILICLSKAIR